MLYSFVRLSYYISRSTISFLLLIVYINGNLYCDFVGRIITSNEIAQNVNM